METSSSECRPTINMSPNSPLNLWIRESPFALEKKTPPPSSSEEEEEEGKELFTKFNQRLRTSQSILTQLSKPHGLRPHQIQALNVWREEELETESNDGK